MKPGVAARVAAADALRRINDEGAYSNVVLRRLPPTLSEGERRAVEATVRGALRLQRRWDRAIAAAAGRDVASLDPEVRAVLRLLAQETFGDVRPSHAVVDTAVEAIRELGRPQAAGFVNAVGRKLTTTSAPTGREGEPGFPFGVADWIYRELVTALGRTSAEEFLSASNEAAVLGVRHRPGREPPTGYSPAEGIAGAGFLPSPPSTPGDVDIIDPASTAVALALEAQPGMSVLDVAAAPGGKTAALWDAMAGRGILVAADRHRSRLARTRRRLNHLGAKPHYVVMDGRVPAFPEGSFDRILVDAPCTGLGTLRRRPEIRHRLDPEAPRRMAELQTAIVDAALRLLKPAGRLVYSACTLFPAETVEVVAALDAHPPEGLPGERWGNGLLLAPHTTGTDGMFMAVVERVSR